MENLLFFIQEQLILVIILILIITLLIRHESAKAGVKLSCSQVVQSINSGESVLLDIRETNEFKLGHIVDAINIPYHKISYNLQQLEKYNGQQIIVADNAGQYSGEVVKTLNSSGFNVVRLGGGLSEWKENNLPLIK